MDSLYRPQFLKEHAGLQAEAAASVVFFLHGLKSAIPSVTFPDQWDVNPSRLNGIAVLSQIAEVIDLKTYRDQKAAKDRAARAADAFADQFYYGQAPIVPFAMPVAVFVFWPGWFVVPHAPALSRDGSGSA